MKLLASIHGLAFALFHRTQVEEEMDEELHAHIQNRADDLEHSGLSREGAERRARIEFGGYQKFKEECREALGTHFVDTLLQDARFAVRMLRKNPGLTLVAVLAPALRRTVWEVDKDQPIEKIQTVEQVLSDSISDRHFYMLLLGIFAGIALLLAVAGIYAVMSYFVSERAHEIGLRIALGVGRSDVLLLVVGQGLILTLVGVAFGVSGGLVLTRYLASLLYGVSPIDPATFATVSCALSAVALLACYIPARRAMRVDPMVALRCE